MLFWTKFAIMVHSILTRARSNEIPSSKETNILSQRGFSEAFYTKNGQTPIPGLIIALTWASTMAREAAKAEKGRVDRETLPRTRVQGNAPT